MALYVISLFTSLDTTENDYTPFLHLLESSRGKTTRSFAPESQIPSLQTRDVMRKWKSDGIPATGSP